MGDHDFPFGFTDFHASQGLKPKVTSSSGDGGRITMKRVAGTVENNRFRKRRKRELTGMQKAHAAYAMAKNLMPRTKVVSFHMFNHYDSTDIPTNTDHRYSGLDNLNLVAELHDRSGIGGAETTYLFQDTVVASGHSMTVVNGNDNRGMLRAAIFPLSHINLIRKGDNFDQRLGDFVELAGMHISGRIQCKTYSPTFFNDPNTDIYPPSKYTNLLESMPRPIANDPQRKVRLMLVEVFDSDQTVSTSTFNDPTVYADTTWNERANDGTIMAELMIVGAPRLEQLLDVVSIALPSTNINDHGVMEYGRWLKIDRKYRSNHRNDNLYETPGSGRAIHFRVLKDMSFTLKPSGHKKATSNANEVRGGYARNSYVDVDMFWKLNVDLSYVTHDADVSQATNASNGTRKFFVYLFDDHCDCLNASGQVNPAVVLNGFNSLLGSVVDEGYSMCQANLHVDIFFNDDL